MGVDTKIRDLIAKQLGIDPAKIKTESSFIEDLGADSLDIVELIMALEEEIGVEIPDEQAEKLRTVGDVETYMKSKRTTTTQATV